MTLHKILVTILSLFGIAFTYWFFLLKKDDEVQVKGSVDILVDGGYNPSVISIAKGQSTTINFLRKDPSNCLEEVILPEFKIKKFLPLNEKVSIQVTPLRAGVFPFACGMNMFHGKIIVK